MLEFTDITGKKVRSDEKLEAAKKVCFIQRNKDKQDSHGITLSYHVVANDLMCLVLTIRP